MIDLTHIRGSVGTPRMLDWGGTLFPALGGVRQRLNRLGTRYAFAFQTVPMYMEGEARAIIADLQRAKLQGGRILYPQLSMNIGGPGSTLANGAQAAGTTLQIKSGTPYYVIRKGQALNVIKSGRRYLYFAAAQSQFNSSGVGSVTLTVPMRTVLAGDEVIDFKTPCIEGYIEGNDLAWSIEAAQLTGLQFQIEERA